MFCWAALSALDLWAVVELNSATLSIFQFQPLNLPLVHFCGEEIPKRGIVYDLGSLWRRVGWWGVGHGDQSGYSPSVTCPFPWACLQPVLFRISSMSLCVRGGNAALCMTHGVRTQTHWEPSLQPSEVSREQQILPEEGIPLAVAHTFSTVQENLSLRWTLPVRFTSVSLSENFLPPHTAE